MIQVLKIAFNCWLHWRWMKDINRTAAIWPLPALCNGPRNISCVHHSHLFQEFPWHCANPTAERSPQLPLPNSPTRSCQLMAALQENISTTQAARGATWMGAFWNKKKKKKMRGGERRERTGKKKREKKRTKMKCINIGGKMSSIPRWSCPGRFSYLCPCHTMCLACQEDTYVIQTPSNALHCSTGTVTASPGHHPHLTEAEMNKSSWINAHGQFMLPLCSAWSISIFSM